MAHIVLPNHDEAGNRLPIQVACFLKLKDKYLTEKGEYSDNIREALVVNKSTAKRIKTLYAKNAKITELTKEDFDKLKPQPKPGVMESIKADSVDIVAPLESPKVSTDILTKNI